LTKKGADLINKVGYYRNKRKMLQILKQKKGAVLKTDL